MPSYEKKIFFFGAIIPWFAVYNKQNYQRRNDNNSNAGINFGNNSKMRCPSGNYYIDNIQNYNNMQYGQIKIMAI